MPFRILFVCTGNTCRSPMAESLAASIFAEIGETEWEAASAGLHATPGSLASSGAQEIAREHALDLESFQSRRVDAEILERSDLVLVMEPGHRTGILNVSPLADMKTYLLGELADREGLDAAVADPFGGNVDSYRRTFEKIRTLIREGIPRIRELARASANDSQGESP